MSERVRYFVTYAPNDDETQPTLKAAREQAGELVANERCDAVIYVVAETVKWRGK